MTFLKPFFFLLLDSWLGSACWLELEPFAAGWALVESLLFAAAPAGGSAAVDAAGEVEEPDCAPSAPTAAPEGAAGSLPDAEPFALEPVGAGSDSGLPGVIVSTAAVLRTPTLEEPEAGEFGCSAIPRVSSPDSLAGVMVGSPLLAAMETSGEFFRMPVIRLIRFG